ncbi:hypothetical protein ADUPG1_010147 [Aduncisulcus paluster]|uniref:MMS19 nucleotide excision repair protein n=1 Tax=Aduncisulcus paluster TaxID=2918883 RepID=A0ABQ5L1W9_9EUKA|nr:hypothetical protein ADUPG1_010147 [Aduncisulcus paluster]|eukprot:gnl/Carplike_NY0171/1231_a1658_856.p1 GENE.gnl/Carplike_NY0171/1231_a1658_856~~gnl/Carplike_NY0171/1231_a1658_856.p1  ORF type:complete len:959 (-),score=239.20 gnl/Carplike_NY0171/1231_a1658_856:125-3001(-)
MNGEIIYKQWYGICVDYAKAVTLETIGPDHHKLIGNATNDALVQLLQLNEQTYETTPTTFYSDSSKYDYTEKIITIFRMKPKFSHFLIDSTSPLTVIFLKLAIGIYYSLAKNTVSDSDTYRLLSINNSILTSLLPKHDISPIYPSIYSLLVSSRFTIDRFRQQVYNTIKQLPPSFGNDVIRGDMLISIGTQDSLMCLWECGGFGVGELVHSSSKVSPQMTPDSSPGMVSSKQVFPSNFDRLLKNVATNGRLAHTIIQSISAACHVCLDKVKPFLISASPSSTAPLTYFETLAVTACQCLTQRAREHERIETGGGEEEMQNVSALENSVLSTNPNCRIGLLLCVGIPPELLLKNSDDISVLFPCITSEAVEKSFVDSRLMNESVFVQHSDDISRFCLSSIIVPHIFGYLNEYKDERAKDPLMEKHTHDTLHRFSDMLRSCVRSIFGSVSFDSDRILHSFKSVNEQDDGNCIVGCYLCSIMLLSLGVVGEGLEGICCSILLLSLLKFNSLLSVLCSLTLTRISVSMNEINMICEAVKMLRRMEADGRGGEGSCKEKETILLVHLASVVCDDTIYLFANAITTLYDTSNPIPQKLVETLFTTMHRIMSYKAEQEKRSTFGQMYSYVLILGEDERESKTQQTVEACVSRVTEKVFMSALTLTHILSPFISLDSLPHAVFSLCVLKEYGLQRVKKETQRVKDEADTGIIASSGHSRKEQEMLDSSTINKLFDDAYDADMFSVCLQKMDQLGLLKEMQCAYATKYLISPINFVSFPPPIPYKLPPQIESLLPQLAMAIPSCSAYSRSLLSASYLPGSLFDPSEDVCLSAIEACEGTLVRLGKVIFSQMISPSTPFPSAQARKGVVDVIVQFASFLYEGVFQSVSKAHINIVKRIVWLLELICMCCPSKRDDLLAALVKVKKIIKDQDPLEQGIDALDGAIKICEASDKAVHIQWVMETMRIGME